MSAITFDTLAYTKKLKAAGVPEKQAEVQAETFAEIIEERIATKHDIELPRRDMKEMEIELKRDMKELELRLKHDLTIRMGTITAASIAIVATLVKLL
jgi:predicted phage-related endonuclease